jgi:hypothetical protein
MNDANANSPALKTDGLKPADAGWSAEPSPPGESWPWRKMFFLVAFATAAHFALIYFFGTKQQTIPRPVANVPHLQLAGDDNEWITLGNPALFALPNPHDFSSVIWARIPVIATPTFTWTEAPQWLRLDAKTLGATFNQFMETNRLAEVRLDLKPQPELAAADGFDTSALPQNSQLKLLGALAGRGLLNPVYLPAQFVNDVIPPSKVQVLVDAAGNVLSAVLLPSNNSFQTAGQNATADQKALTVARQLRFAPAAGLTLGEMLFLWHTLPDLSTNPPATQ